MSELKLDADVCAVLLEEDIKLVQEAMDSGSKTVDEVRDYIDWNRSFEKPLMKDPLPLCPTPPAVDDNKLNDPEFRKDLAAVLNKHSIENTSDTPDFILAACLNTYNEAVRSREEWYGRNV